MEIETRCVPGSNASNPKEKFEGKVSKRLAFFHGPQKKVVPRRFCCFFNRKVTNILFKNVKNQHGSAFLGGPWKYASRFDTFPSKFSFGFEAFEPGTCLLSISKEISNSLSTAAEGKIVFFCDTESRKSTRNSPKQIEFRQITLKDR